MKILDLQAIYSVFLGFDTCIKSIQFLIFIGKKKRRDLVEIKPKLALMITVGEELDMSILLVLQLKFYSLAYSVIIV